MFCCLIIFWLFVGNFEEKTPPGTVQLLTPSAQTESLQPTDLPEKSKSETIMAVNSNGTEPEIVLAEVAVAVSEEVKKDDLLRSFLPPPATSKCHDELQVFHSAQQ